MMNRDSDDSKQDHILFHGSVPIETASMVPPPKPTSDDLPTDSVSDLALCLPNADGDPCFDEEALRFPGSISSDLERRLSRATDHSAGERSYDDPTHSSLEEVLGDYLLLHAHIADVVTQQMQFRQASLEGLSVLAPFVNDLCKAGKNICLIEKVLSPYRQGAPKPAPPASVEKSEDSSF